MRTLVVPLLLKLHVTSVVAPDHFYLLFGFEVPCLDHLQHLFDLRVFKSFVVNPHFFRVVWGLIAQELFYSRSVACWVFRCQTSVERH